MKILLIGGCGYIGSRIYKELKGHTITSVDLEWYGDFGVKNLKKDYGHLAKDFVKDFDVVIALAGYSSERMCKGILPEVVANNVLNFSNLVSDLEKGQKLIFSSSCRVYYGAKSNKEDCLVFSSPEPYDISMYMREMVAKSSKADIYGLRLATVNGFSTNFRRESMINSMVDSFKKRGFAEISNSNNNRSVVDIKDLMEVFKRIISYGNPENTGIYNISGFSATVREIGKEVGKVLGCKVIDNGDCSNPLDFSMDTTKFNQTFSFKPKGSVKSIVEGILENYDKMEFTERINPIKYA